jgi:hypothetical protein
VARKPTDPVKLQLRLNESLRRQLERRAARNARSMNAEIIHRLEESIRGESAVDIMRGALLKMEVLLEHRDEKDARDMARDVLRSAEDEVRSLMFGKEDSK